jgi:hypothetical protein
MKKGQFQVWLSASALGDDPPVRAKPEYEIAVASKNCPRKFSLLRQITDNEK